MRERSRLEVVRALLPTQQPDGIISIGGIFHMRRIDYKGEELLIHTRSGQTVLDTLREHGIATEFN